MMDTTNNAVMPRMRDIVKVEVWTQVWVQPCQQPHHELISLDNPVILFLKSERAKHNMESVLDAKLSE